jgi:Zn-dependent peptidase ImmA (M78 family)
MTRNSPPVNPSVHLAIQAVWSDAGFERPVPGIVPLNELVVSYPIWVAEVENLSFERAASYLATSTGQNQEFGLVGSGPLSGFFYAYQYRQSFVGCILVERRDPIVRRRFSVAHELGHYKLHFLPQIGELVSDQLREGLMIADAMNYVEQGDGSDDLPLNAGFVFPIQTGEVVPQLLIMDEEKEIEANQFAAELLMPANSLLERIATIHLPPGQLRGYLAKCLACEFLVSKEAMSRRLAALGV